ncbi:MAG TPA: phage tail protein [Candidatus Binatia bacterium]|nr:phage tail protein [Candidatus Binatia bacterium]
MIRLDPMMAYNFQIALIDSSNTVVDPNHLLAATDTGLSAMQVISAIAGTLVGGFSECSGLDTQLETEDYKEGGLNDRVRKFPSRTTWSNIILKRGVGLGEDLWTWHYDYVSGKGKRRDGIIVLENDLHIPLKVWHFSRGLPVKWTGPAFNAKTSEVAIESLEIAHEGLDLTSPGTVAGAALNAVAGSF